jgi:Ca2+-binding RTX toxin-like protein
LTGAEEADTFLGGTGSDLLGPGGGVDLADGGEGEDRIEARDGRGDLVRGGVGADSAVTDALTVDAVDGVESLDATPEPVPATPAAANADRRASVPALGRIRVHGGPGKPTVKVPLTCPAGEAGGCVTSLTLETAAPVKLGSLHAAVVLGSGRVVLAAGQQRTATVRLAGGAATLARHGRLRARLRLESSDAAGNSATRSVAVALRIPRDR